ncbi:MAG: hypothetical protein IKH57_12580 [Clostridia bacterium]|nr:hypothetical protein [Clostridia bacterium]
MEDKTTKRIIIILAVLVLCFCSQALAEELTAQPDTGSPAVEQQPSNGASSSDPLVNPPVAAEEEQAEAPAQEPPAEETASPETAEPANNEDAGSPENETAEPEKESGAEEQANPENEAVLPEDPEPSPDQDSGDTEETPLCQEHAWSEWEDRSDLSLPACEREQIKVRHCLICGCEETDIISAPGHQWQALSYTEATCTGDGAAVRVCASCGKEDTIVLPAYGHTYVQMDENDGSRQKVCALCGDVKEEAKSEKSHMYYNNTVTSFGPTTRELIGGSVWNRVTPVDLSQEGVFTYPLVASNMYTIGTATLVNEEDSQEINYKLSSPKINVHSESLVVYPDLESLKTGENAVSFDFDSPIDLKSRFGENARVIVAITLKADYDADSIGVRYFYVDQNLIDQMMAMIQ